ncbi:MAG: LCP family protein [Clostridia bacterium]|nr:LCP family protein [Clostridia bacterium]
MAKKNAKKGKRALLTILLVLLLVLLTAAGGAVYVVDHYLDKINKINPDDDYIIPPEDETFETDDGAPDTPTSSAPAEGNTSSDAASGNASSDPASGTSSGTVSGNPSSGTSSKPASSTAPAEPAVKFDDSKLIHILLVGQDKNPGVTVRQRSDSMILCSINPETKEVSLISFLRDLYVEIPGGYSNNRLNATYAFGGFKLLNRTLTHNFGVHIDGNIEVDFSRFQKVIDAVGGVDIALTTAEARHLIGPTATACTIHMDGVMALKYARIRIIDSDFNRTARQRNVIMAVFNKIKSKSVPELMQLAETILPMLSTDMSNTELVSLMYQMAPMISGMKISNYSIPAKGTYYSTYIRGMAVLVPNLNKNRTLLRDKYLPLN